MLDPADRTLTNLSGAEVQLQRSLVLNAARANDTALAQQEQRYLQQTGREMMEAERLAGLAQQCRARGDLLSCFGPPERCWIDVLH